MRTTGALLAAVITLSPAAALAQGEPDLSDLMHARNYAMGGAFYALGLGAEAVLGNPGGMSLYRRYQAELTGGWDLGTPFAFGSVSIVDSVTSPVAAGLSYHLVSLGRLTERTTVHLYRLGVGLGLADWLHVGMTGKHLIATDPSAPNALSFDVGLLVRPVAGLTVGASGHNLVETDFAAMPRYWVLASAFTSGLFSAAADLRADFPEGAPMELRYGLGAEYIVGVAPLRLGYSAEPALDTHFLGGGFGFVFQGGGVDLAYRHQLNGPGRVLVVTVKMGG